MVRPMMVCPSARSMAATVEESTPPDIATAIVCGLGMLLTHHHFLVGWRQFPQPRDCLRYERQGEVDIFVAILFSQTEADAGAGSVGAQAHCGEHVRWFDRARGTGGARRNRQALQVERDDHRFPFDVIEINVGCIWHAGGAFPVDGGFFHLRENSLLQTVTQGGHLLIAASPETLHCQLRSLAECDNSGNILSSGATRTFVSPPIKQRLKMGSSANEERAHALRRVHLVTGNR